MENVSTMSPGQPNPAGADTHRPDVILAQQIRLLYDQALPSFLVSVVVALVTMLLLWDAADHPLILAWFLALTLINVIRGISVLVVKRRNPAPASMRGWRTAYVLGAFLSGLSWGLLGLFLDVSWPVGSQVILYVALMGVASGGLASNAVMLRAYVAFMIPILVPLALLLTREHEQMYFNMGVLVGLYGVMLIQAARGYQRNVIHALSLAQDNASLLSSLYSTNQGLEREIQERTQAEAELQAEKEKALVTLDSIGDAVITTDQHGRVEFINPVAENLTGLSIGEAHRRPLEDVIAFTKAQGDEPVPVPMYRTLHTGRAANSVIPVRLRNHGSGEHFITFTTAPLREKSGRLFGTVLVLHDVSETQRMARELAYRASHDPLTGLVNRHEFEARLKEALNTAKRDRRTHLMLYLDLDQFKIVNDTCGHSAGDELLKQLAVVLQGSLRRSDTLGRLGGDEFGVLLEGCLLDNGLGIANHLRQTVQEFRFTWDDKIFMVGASIGAVVVDHDSEDASGLLRAADVACYVAKDLGRNRVHVYEEGNLDMARRQGEMRWVTRVNRALEEDRLVLFHQTINPVVPGRPGPRHMEILIRMRDEAGDLAPPQAFLPAAERYNLMPTVDRWVVESCFKWYVRTGQRDLVCSINLSGTSLSDDNFLAFIHEQFERTGMLPRNTCFEITETAAVADLATASRFITELRDLGCRFSLDDFGSGLSSFGYLKNLPVDYLKIDGSFVRDMAKDPVDRAMVEAINRVGHVMGKETIAEFVEDQAILEQLAAVGVDYAQGYHFGKPSPLEDWSDGNVSARPPRAPAEGSPGAEYAASL